MSAVAGPPRADWKLILAPSVSAAPPDVSLTVTGKSAETGLTTCWVARPSAEASCAPDCTFSKVPTPVKLFRAASLRSMPMIRRSTSMPRCLKASSTLLSLPPQDSWPSVTSTISFLLASLGKSSAAC